MRHAGLFDSTPQGNIGPVATALCQALNLPQTVYCPAFPKNSRTVYRGHLFVGDQLLNEDPLPRRPSNHETRPILVYSTAAAGEVTQQQARLGRARAASGLEKFQAAVARLLVEEAQVRKLIVAGGETSGAVVQRLGIRGLEIGPEICPGVPWTRSLASPLLTGALTGSLTLALKSGNFGEDDFFLEALNPRQTATV